MIDLNPFVAWQQEKPDTRRLDIKFSPYEKNGFSIYAYDSSLRTGDLVTTVEEINLEKKHEAEQRAEYERLKAKFESREDVNE